MTTDPSEFDPQRRLCADGSCVGVIGADGRCKACGLAADGSGERRDADATDATDAAAPFDAGGDGAVQASSAHAASTSSLGTFDPARRLCDDGSCLGVVGADGVCPLCGRRAGTAG